MPERACCVHVACIRQSYKKIAYTSNLSETKIKKNAKKK